MHLYILKRLDRAGYDEVRGVIVRADSVDHAREIAAAGAYDEGASCWRNLAQTSCELLESAGEPGAILWDIKEG